MPDPKIHFLNVRLGDCALMERSSGRVTMIDICCGNLATETLIESALRSVVQKKPRGNYQMCGKPTNPLTYLSERGITEIWRFVLSHPDMDHMDGIRRLFAEKSVLHFWDCGIRREKPDFGRGGQYREEDWDFYAALIAGQVGGTKIVTPRAGSSGKYWNRDDDDGNGRGDWLHVVSPPQGLVDEANQGGQTNDASYVLVYRSAAGPVIFSGDSTFKSWEYIIDNHRDMVENAAVLFAPHHGRGWDGDYSYLDVVKPRVSFFGCAPNQYLNYGAWDYRNLLFFTNNQCGSVHVYPAGDRASVFIENFSYALDYTGGGTYLRDGFWFLCEV